MQGFFYPLPRAPEQSESPATKGDVISYAGLERGRGKGEGVSGRAHRILWSFSAGLFPRIGLSSVATRAKELINKG